MLQQNENFGRYTLYQLYPACERGHAKKTILTSLFYSTWKNIFTTLIKTLYMGFSNVIYFFLKYIMNWGIVFRSPRWPNPLRKNWIDTQEKRNYLWNRLDFFIENIFLSNIFSTSVKNFISNKMSHEKFQ